MDKKSYRLFMSDISRLKLRTKAARRIDKELWLVCQAYEKHKQYFEATCGLFEERTTLPHTNGKKDLTRPLTIREPALIEWLEHLMQDEREIMNNFQPIAVLVFHILNAVELSEVDPIAMREWYEEQKA